LRYSHARLCKQIRVSATSEDFISELDFSTLEQCSGSYVTDDLRERHDPDGHSSLMLVCARLRYVAVQKWGAERYMGMKKLEENK
jgi:hypothetical protein